MIKPRRVNLFLKPANCEIEAQIVSLTESMADTKIKLGWWTDDCLDLAAADPLPIDRFWDWNQLEIERDGSFLRSEKVAIVAGDEERVEGAMMISTDPVESVLEPGRSGLFIELLFTAPRNRPRLRKDKCEFLLGVGLKLLCWGAWSSREAGFDGRLLLDGSAEFTQWYLNRGLIALDLPPIVYELNSYQPMELSPLAAKKLLDLQWES
jgi:hypothetical protein